MAPGVATRPPGGARSLAAAGCAAALLLAAAPSGAPPAAPACSPAVRAALLAPATTPDEAVPLACSVTLGPDDVVTRRVVIEGAAASGTVLDCGGGRIGRAEAPPRFPDFTVEIRSRPVVGPAGPAWDRPTDVTIRDCTLAGPLRIWGMGQNGQAEAVKLSSRRPGHTERAQAAAPTRVTLSGITFAASGQTPLYLAPGVTGVTLTGSRFLGESGSIALYLDAESARNTIRDTLFDIATGREVLAVDGSAENRITGNTFRIAWRGGIELYRNCGEGGTVRHQTPSRNLIADNRFVYGWPLHRPAITVGSREGWRLYCGEDDGYPFGSSADNGDGATGNVLRDNVVE